MTVPSIPLGFSAWTSGDDRYTGIYHTRLLHTQALIAANAAFITSRASSLRSNIPCTLSSQFSAGSFNFVTGLLFEDGVQWVVRLLMPPVEKFEGLDEKSIVDWTPTEKDVCGMESEVATMRYIKANTTIPIPTIYHVQTTNFSGVGLPFMFLEHIEGITAYQLNGLHVNLFSIPPQYLEHYFTQIARIMNELATLRFPTIGSLTFTDNEYKIGKIAQTMTGPYTTPHSFYTHYPAALLSSLPESKRSGCRETTALFSTLPFIQDASTEPPQNGFGLANLEIGAHNVMVDAEYNILAIIDWDSTISAPAPVLHHFPFCMSADPGVVGVRSSKRWPASTDRNRLTKRFAEVFDAVGGEGKELDGTGFFTKEALAWRAIMFVRIGMDWADSEFVEGLRWLKGHNENDIEDFYNE